MRPTEFRAEFRLSKTSHLFAILAAETLLIWIVQLKSSLSFSDYGLAESHVRS